MIESAFELPLLQVKKKRIGIFIIANEKLEFHETQKSAEYMK